MRFFIKLFCFTSLFTNKIINFNWKHWINYAFNWPAQYSIKQSPIKYIDWISKTMRVHIAYYIETCVINKMKRKIIKEKKNINEWRISLCINIYVVIYILIKQFYGPFFLNSIDFGLIYIKVSEVFKRHLNREWKNKHKNLNRKLKWNLIKGICFHGVSLIGIRIW